MRKRLMKKNLHLLAENEDLAGYGVTIMGEDLDDHEPVKCEKTLDLFAALSGPMGRVVE